MSVYQKFIDSAGIESATMVSSSKSRQPVSFVNSLSLSSKQKQQLLRGSSSSSTNKSTSKSATTSPSKGSLAMLRQQTMSNLHLPTIINSTISSTPLANMNKQQSQQQYKRLVEADYYSAIGFQQQQQHFCQHQQYQQQHQHQHQQQQQQQYQVCHQHQRQINHLKQQQQQTAAIKATTRPMSPVSAESILDTKDPVLREWLRAMRFETELECLTSLQARTLAIDEPAAGALSVRNSQVAIQEMSLESSFIMDYLNHLIEALPLMFNTVPRFAIEFTELWSRLAAQTAARVNTNQMQISSNSNQQHNNYQHHPSNTTHLTVINCTPRKSAATSARVTRPLDRLAARIRTICHECANLLCEYEENSSIQIDNAYLEASLRQLKELYGQFVEISMRAECANIVRALDYDFSQSSLNRLSSSSSLQAVRPFESTSAQLPLKWALIALWQLTKNDSYLCRVLTEKWHTHQQQPANSNGGGGCSSSPPSNKVAKRLDYSTKYDSNGQPAAAAAATIANNNNSGADEGDYVSSLRSDYQKLYTQTMQNSGVAHLMRHRANADQENQNHHQRSTSGALSCALKTKQQSGIKQVSTIELLIDIIISQPNKHERLDVMNLIHLQAQNDKLIDVDEWDQSVSAAIYTSNQYKVAALRILNHLCVNDQAVKTILKCFSTPPPSQGQPIPENKIIRSIFECYQSSQEHIYQNETMFRAANYGGGGAQRKRTKYQQSQHSHQQQQQMDFDEEYSDYGSRQTPANSINDSIDESDDVVVKEAISLLVQLTTPFHRSQQGLDYYTLIGRFSIDSLVKYLTNIIKSTSSREMIFLSLTALANISFITTEPMKHYETNRVVLDIFRASKSRSKDLELRDQAVTILANTADKNLLDIVSSGGLNFLLSCLESCPNRMVTYGASKGSNRCLDDSLTSVVHIENRPGDRRPIGQFLEELPEALGCSCDQAESSLAGALHGGGRTPIVSDCLARLSTADLSAMERIHQKTAVAFARMSADPGVTRMILNHGGVKQLIDLCKFGQRRNHSDTVLIACIAALRKMSKVIDNETFKNYHALDLIQLDLNRTLEIYGNSRSIVEAQQRMFASDV